MTIAEIDRVLYIGAGTMGCANSLVAAVSGYQVVLHDARAESLDGVPDQHGGVAAFLVASGYCTEVDVAAALPRVTLEADLSKAVLGVDLVSESIPEDLDLKRRVFADLDDLAPPSTILTTNTSALQVSEIEDAVRRGDRFAALHSHLGSLLVDIVGGPRTSSATIDTLRRYVLSLGAVPLVLDKEHPGYVFNALNGPLLATALHLLVDERADRDTIDRTWMVERGAPMGPFGMIDLFGIDVVAGAWRRPSDDPAREALRTKVSPLLEQYVTDADLGMKTGSGFYEYPDPAYQAPAFLTASDVDGPTADALMTTLVTGALSLAAKGVASPDDIDMAWMVATNLDIGPFGLLDQLGSERFLAIIDQQLADGLLTAEVAEAARTHLADRPA
ncbi:MAG: 3-hydroxyacyl-CoA dehydrogenase NAD-binding domain-containing protein [Acidimicrobiales bacterium]